MLLLDRYGGRAAHGRKDQTSHAWLDHELDMLNNMSRTLPPIFLLVAAFLVNLTLSRLVALEREQIGLLKALGYGNATIALHYVKFVIVLTATGIVIGSAAGTWLGSYITRLFGDFFHFPFLIFVKSPDLYAAAAALSLAAAVIGAIRALRDVVALPPAVAMQPPAPPRFRRLLPGWLSMHGIVSQPTMMMLRNIMRHPVRAAIHDTRHGARDRHPHRFAFHAGHDGAADQRYLSSWRIGRTRRSALSRSALRTSPCRWPGFRASWRSSLIAKFRSGFGMAASSGGMMISGRPRDADLNRIIDVDLRPVVLPETGLAISAMLGQILGVKAGDFVEVDLLEGQRRTVTLPIAVAIEDYFGLRGMMDAEALSRLMREGPAVNGVNLSVDTSRLDDFYEAIKGMPTVSGMALQRVSLVNFRDNVALLITTMASIYTGLAAIIAFGMVYNSARISLSERARELASLRVFGFTRGEVLRILLLELACSDLVAQPLGWVMGYGLAWIMKTNLAGELMRVRLVVEPFTYVLASAVVLSRRFFPHLSCASASTDWTSSPSSRPETEPCARIGRNERRWIARGI